MSRIKHIQARQICDSRANPTVEVRVYLESGVFGWAAVPSGASTGTREAAELRDDDPSRFRGKSVLRAVENVNTKINDLLRRKPAEEQRAIDEAMLDLEIRLGGSKFKQKLGANAILAVSLAVADAAAKEHLGEDRLFEYIAHLRGGRAATTLPVPMMNVLNGGEHATNLLRLQEFMIMPVGAATLFDALCMGSRVFEELSRLVDAIPDNPAVGVGDEGGYSPMLCPGQSQQKKVRAALDLVSKAVEQAGLRPGTDVVFALDAAASEFFNTDKRVYEFSYQREPPAVELSSDEMIAFYEQLIAEYPIMSIEDGLAEQDDQGWIQMTRRLGAKLQIVGDDLFVTNRDILAQGIAKGQANSILIKVNQIGSLTETLDTIALADEHGYTCVVSHRSGETLDTKIADLAVGCNTGQIKTGSMSRGDRIAKYNRLKDIELLGLAGNGAYPGAAIFSRFGARQR